MLLVVHDSYKILDEELILITCTKDTDLTSLRKVQNVIPMSPACIIYMYLFYSTEPRYSRPGMAPIVQPLISWVLPSSTWPGTILPSPMMAGYILPSLLRPGTI